jgi:hypothetical protein
MNNATLERMAKYIEVDPDTACTGWLGGKDQDGYPMFWYEGKTERASRALWKLIYGGIPEGLIVRHKCDNPACLNLDHLELGTHKENTGDALERGRMQGPVKVTEEKKAQILSMRRQGISLASIAQQLNISVSSLYNYLPAELKRKGNYR